MYIPMASVRFKVKTMNKTYLPFSSVLSFQEQAVTRGDSLELFDKMQDIASSVAGDMTEKDIENEIKISRIERKNKR